ncbi:MAG TPA: TIGR04013 family B12-binding domain/radical SAM domain-containing protein [Candidatus Bathyarchaeia archaeon]|nr:TIGR04013 family B12-binding domain/radical SAM domain-containing protein [Candidatus Bathyarchaeia archaeon]
MNALVERLIFPLSENNMGIVFYYSRANIYSYHALIGALEFDTHTANIPTFIPKPDYFKQEINRLFSIEKFSNLIVAFSVATFQLEKIQEMIKNLQKHPRRQNMIIVVGGPHPSALPNDLLITGADAVVIGEGEKTICELVKRITKGENYQSIKGIAYLDQNKKLIPNQKNDPINLDAYPPFAPKKELYSALEITRGCNFGCKYCQVPTLFSRPARHRSPENVIKWGEFLLTKRENWDFRFITPNAFGYGAKKSSEPNVEMIKKLLSGLHNLQAKKRKRIYFGTFPSEVRPESVTNDTLNLTKEFCHNDNLTMGAQSGSPKVLQQIKRGHTVEDVISAVDLARSYGFTMNIDFILGFPEEADEDQYLTMDLCKKLVKKDCKIHMHYLIPLPGTEYANVKPRPIVPDILKTIRKWSNDGIIFGSWQHQFTKVRKGSQRKKE